ncbi:MAG: MFS transporter, partial [Planctomycetes bacterium]|nr:MFS transporter [Planctomycetota bacterium]
MSAARSALLAAVTFLVMMPETLPVPVLRGLVVDRFGVGHTLASLFMVANMLGAIVAAPLAGLWVDRFGRRRRLCVFALVADALLMQALAHPVDYAIFLGLRVLEGACHIVALTLLMSLVADRAGEHRGRALGALGVGLTLGVATGAAVGGVLGRSEPLLTL